ncbi:hypothetical protein [Kibdelosporangium phytohabitans]|nr:hypothetical protein [Kibdelosporangium phytohabitans]MBE1467785.1 hypothetical protein [Kibdelosporangium phytohabitans]
MSTSTSCGGLVMGEDIWPMHKPRSFPGKQLPWDAILDAIVSAVQNSL